MLFSSFGWIPAFAGMTERGCGWIPAFAGMTERGCGWIRVRGDDGERMRLGPRSRDGGSE
jgi:hypothetical protein